MQNAENELLRAENDRLRARCARYRQEMDTAMAEAREYDRAKVKREKLLYTVSIIAGGAVGTLALCKVIEWLRYFAGR